MPGSTLSDQIETVSARIALLKMEMTGIQSDLREMKKIADRELRQRITAEKKKENRRRNASTRSPRSAGFGTVVMLSAPLAKFLGEPQMSRIEAVKKIWNYAKLHNLVQRNTETNRLVLHPSPNMNEIFESVQEPITYPSLQKILSPHFNSVAVSKERN